MKENLRQVKVTPDEEQKLYFSTPIYYWEKPEFLKPLNKALDPYIKKAKDLSKKTIKEQKRTLGDFGIVHHSDSIAEEKSTKKLRDVIGEYGCYILSNEGYNIKNYSLHFSDMWVQEFPKKGGGHHMTHVHSSHLSGFYFLKCSDKTSYPIFYDPRTGKNTLQLPEIDEKNITIASDKVFYNVVPGSLLIFPSYLPHSFVVDEGIDPFRFIHFNLTAYPHEI